MRKRQAGNLLQKSTTATICVTLLSKQYVKLGRCCCYYCLKTQSDFVKPVVFCVVVSSTRYEAQAAVIFINMARETAHSVFCAFFSSSNISSSSLFRESRRDAMRCKAKERLLVYEIIFIKKHTHRTTNCSQYGTGFVAPCCAVILFGF